MLYAEELCVKEIINLIIGHQCRFSQCQEVLRFVSQIFTDRIFFKNHMFFLTT